LVCNKDGNVIDDVLVYSGTESADPFGFHKQSSTLIVCNASNRKRIWKWFNDQARGFDVELRDTTFQTAMLALQGPDSEKVLQPLVNFDLSNLKYYNFSVEAVGGALVMVSRTGYTGEDGFELIVTIDEARKVFDAVWESGQEHDLRLIGLGARDSLRLEAGMPLYGHEIGDTINPIEAGLDWAVDFSKKFIGKKKLQKAKKKGCDRTLVGLVVEGKRIAREGFRIWYNGEHIGEIASGTKSPTLDQIIATALIPTKVREEATEVQIELKEDNLVTATIVSLPFYKREKKILV